MTRAATQGVLGCVAVAGWLTLFAAGLLVDSKAYRDRINIAPTAAIAGTAANTGGERSASTNESGFAWTSFGAAMLTYTPLNAAFLVILAGLIGGCASNLTYIGQLPAETPGPTATVAEARAAQRVMYLTESPFASMLRSFVVYVGFVAGVYVTANAPFDHPTTDQYVRFVGTMSLMAFVVGYDPTKFQDLLSMVPRPGQK